MDGTTTMDHDEDEIKRQMTISAGLAHVDWDEHKINLVDTPGEASFINEALGTLPVVESVLMVVNAVTKVEVQTERVWKRAAEMGVSRVAAVNMMDRERADFGEAVEALRGPLRRRGGGRRPAHRRGGRLPGGRRPGGHEGLHLRRRAPARARGADPGRPAGRRRRGPREARRPGGRSRRRAAREVPGRRGALARGDHWTPARPPWRRAPSPRSSPCRPPRTSGTDRLLELLADVLPSPVDVGARIVASRADGSE